MDWIGRRRPLGDAGQRRRPADRGHGQQDDRPDLRLHEDEARGRRPAPTLVGTGPRPLATTPGPPLLGGLADAVPHLVWVAAADGTVHGLQPPDRGLRALPGAGPTWPPNWEPMVHPDDLAATRRPGSGGPASGTIRARAPAPDGRRPVALASEPRVAMTNAGDGETCGTAPRPTSTPVGARRSVCAGPSARSRSRCAAARWAGGAGPRDRGRHLEPRAGGAFGFPAGSFGGSPTGFLSFVLPEDQPRCRRCRRGRSPTGPTTSSSSVPPRRRHDPLDGRPWPGDLRR